jgi:Skp family chaperone for outer membrane proteins
MARRKATEPAFGSDSFLDVIANLVGIVLIIIVLVAARIRELPDLVPAALAQAEAEAPRDEQSGPLLTEIQLLESELAELQRRLLEALKAFDLAAERKDSLEKQRAEAQAQATGSQAQLTDQRRDAANVQQELTRADQERRSLQERIAELQRAIQDLEKTPRDRRVLHFHLPVSKPVSAGELFFELRAGRVSFIDLQGFLDQVKQKMPQKVEELRRRWEVNDVTESLGAFRMRYTVARERTTGLDRAFGDHPPTEERGFASALDEWIIEPILAVRGETLADALVAQSRFRQVIDLSDPDQLVLTFFVYADSFELYRQLRDWLYERGFRVAGRPLALDRPISGSRNGTLSRGQ